MLVRDVPAHGPYFHQVALLVKDSPVNPSMQANGVIIFIHPKFQGAGRIIVAQPG
jgi:hypothetical protein